MKINCILGSNGNVGNVSRLSHFLSLSLSVGYCLPRRNVDHFLLIDFS